MKEVLERLDGLQSSFEEKIESVRAQGEERAAALETKLENLQKEGGESAAEDIQRTLDEVDDLSLTLNLDKKDIEKFSVSRAIYGHAKGNPEKYCPFELDLHRQIVKHNQAALEKRAERGIDGTTDYERAMSTLTDSKGGFLVAEEISNTFYGNYRPRTVRGQLNVTEISNAGIPLRFNKKTGNTTGYRRGEGTSVAASDVTFGQLSLSPKSVGARTVISEENLMWATPSVDSIVRSDLVETIELKKDYDMIAGTGASNQPIGVINTTGVVNNDAGSGSGQDPTYEVVGIDLPFLLEDADVLIDDGSLAYLGVPGHIKMLRKEQYGGSTTGDGPHVIPAWQMPVGGEFMPYRWTSSTQFQGQGLGADSGASPLFFGRWSDVIHVNYGGMHIKTSDVATDGTYNALTEGWMHIVITAWDDCGVIRPASIVYDNSMNHE